MNELSHLDETGKAKMVNIGSKPPTERMAIAEGEVTMHKDTFALVKAGSIQKGDVLTLAQIAGIMAAKKTAHLIPLCHPIEIHHIDVQVSLKEDLPGVKIRAIVRTNAPTGVEMEALTAVSMAALTVYDMAKAVDKNMVIQNIRLLEKRGGLSGDVINV